MKNKIMKAMVCTLAGLSLTACATKSIEVPPTSVSYTKYENYSCDKLRKELDIANEDVSYNAVLQDKRASNDTGIVVVAVFIWPLAFLVKGDGISTVDLANAKGEVRAINDSLHRKECS